MSCGTGIHLRDVVRNRPLEERIFDMSLAIEFKEWFRKSVFTHSKGATYRFDKLCKRLETLEARPTVRAKRPVQQAKAKIKPSCNRQCYFMSGGFCHKSKVCGDQMAA